MQQQYEGPAGVHFSPDDLLIVWQALNLAPNDENAELRKRIKRHLELYQPQALVNGNGQ